MFLRVATLLILAATPLEPTFADPTVGSSLCSAMVPLCFNSANIFNFASLNTDIELSDWGGRLLEGTESPFNYPTWFYFQPAYDARWIASFGWYPALDNVDFMVRHQLCVSFSLNVKCGTILTSFVSFVI